jgi:hypothetical protein
MCPRPSPRPRSCRLDVHLDCHCLQPGSVAQAGRGGGLTMPGIFPGTAKTAKIYARACLKHGLQQPGHEFSTSTRQSALRHCIFPHPASARTQTDDSLNRRGGATPYRAWPSMRLWEALAKSFPVSVGFVPEKSCSRQTPRWREMDSN